MAHKDWCGRPCSDCQNHCRLDEEIPCSPDCENLNEDGSRETESCKGAECDAIVDEAGECPNCGNSELNYGKSGLVGEVYSYEWACGQCGTSGKEVYNLEFACHVLN